MVLDAVTRYKEAYEGYSAVCSPGKEWLRRMFVDVARACWVKRGLDGWVFDGLIGMGREYR